MNIGKVRRANGKSDIAFVFAKKALYLFVRVFSVMKGDFRVFLFKSRDTFRSYQAQDAVSRKKIDFSVLALIDLLDVFVNVVVGIQNLRQMFIEVFSGFRECDAGSSPVQQLCLELKFQVFLWFCLIPGA